MTVFDKLSNSLEPVVITTRTEGRKRGIRLRLSFAGSSVAPGTHGKTLSCALTIPCIPSVSALEASILSFCYNTLIPLTNHRHLFSHRSHCRRNMSLAISRKMSAAVTAARWSVLCVLSDLRERLFDRSIKFPHWTLLLYLDSELLNFVSPPSNSKSRHGTLIRTQLSLATALSLFYLVDNVILHRL